MMAEALCKRLGHDATGQPGSWENGTAAVMKYARGCGVAAESISMDDGSGLSAKNRISAKAFTTVLAHVAASADGEQFVASLAEPGEDGTLKKRFVGMAVAKGIHAKTGHISGVSTLSGYIDVKTATGSRRFVFSILCNKYVGNVNPLQDQMCEAIYQWASP
jgi:D-alanyl-D-alanine carboxypeptidase/D-alanyl-D-alanine-endopeptidase (penicillin-binding protein 4)